MTFTEAMKVRSHRSIGRQTARRVRRAPRAGRLALSLLLSGVTIAGAVAGCSDDDGGPKGGGAGAKGGQQQPYQGPPVPVTVTVAAVKPVQRSVEVVGTLHGEEDVTVSNKVSGRVIAIYKDVGDRVAPGEVLAQLLKKDNERVLAQRQSALQEVLAQLGLKGIPPDDFDPSALPAVRRARLQEQNARAKYERGRQLHEQQPPLLSDQDFADLETGWEVARSAAEAELLTAQALISEAKTRQAEIAIAEQAVRDTTILAPRPTADYAAGESENEPTTGPATAPSVTQPAVEGSTAPGTRHAVSIDPSDSFAVSARMVSVGELVQVVTPMFRLVDDNPLKLRASVPERFVAEIEVGQRVDLFVEAYSDVFGGEVARINPQIDVANRTFMIEVTVPNDDHRLKPGAFARARVRTRVEPKIVFVPRDSVVSFAGVDKVFTVKEGKAQEVAIALGPRREDADEVEVTKGLKGGEQVVLSGTNKLATGVPVTVNDAGATTQPAEARATPE